MKHGWVLLAAALSGCAGGDYRPVSDAAVKIGAPYRVRGTTYVPAVDPSYDMNGERFRPGGVSAAHTTLPLPSYVEVTALDTGRRILVRVNDRGPFAGRGRILDLSRGAAEALGARGRGVVPVRVRVVSPSERDRARLRRGKAARELPPVDEATRANLRAQLRASGL